MLIINKEALGILVENETIKLRNRDEDCYFISLAKEIQPKREFLTEALIKTGFHTIRPDGGYFILADYLEVMKKLEIQMNESNEQKDSKFVKWMTKNKVNLFKLIYYLQHIKIILNSKHQSFSSKRVHPPFF